MTTRVAVPPGRSRFGVLLAAAQARYQVLLLLRSPIGLFTALIIPVMVLIVLNLATPGYASKELHGASYADFITPAMGTFALVNACYVNVVTSVVVAREEGILKRLNGTPLPLSAYVVGRMAAAAVVALASMTIVYAIGAIFMHVELTAERVAALLGVTALGIATLTTLGLAVSALIPRPDISLPAAYGTMLPVAFISNVFFPLATAPDWLSQVAAAFPLQPIAMASERVFQPGSSGWPMTQGELLVTLAWLAGTSLITAFGFRWQPGGSLLRWPSRHRGASAAG